MSTTQEADALFSGPTFASPEVATTPLISNTVSTSNEPQSLFTKIKTKQCYRAKCWVWVILIMVVIGLIVLYYTLLKKIIWGKHKSDTFSNGVLSNGKNSVNYLIPYDSTDKLFINRTYPKFDNPTILSNKPFTGLKRKCKVIFYNAQTNKLLTYKGKGAFLGVIPQGNSSDKAFCTPYADGNKHIWEYNPNSGSLCPTSNSDQCLALDYHNSKNPILNMVKWEKKLEHQWDLNVDTYTITNRRSGTSLENGGDISTGETLAHYNNDGSFNKKWNFIIIEDM